jgi:hypothetical protein
MTPAIKTSSPMRPPAEVHVESSLEAFTPAQAPPANTPTIR